MQSIAFPNMFSGTKTNIIKDKDATMSNLRLLLESVRGTLLGDPYFGSRLKEVFFENNNVILRDMIVDEIYSCIQIFIPQLYLQRKDIQLIQEKDRIYAKINCINVLDNTTNLYNINLITD